MSTSKKTPWARAWALSALALLTSVSCDLGNDDGGPGAGPGILGAVPTAPGLPPALRVSFKGIQPEPNSSSTNARVSATGRFVVFQSDASNLVAGDTNGASDVFVRDRDVDGVDPLPFDAPGNVTTVRVSVNSSGVQSNGYSFTPSISANGRFVAFGSNATNLAGVDNNPQSDIYLHDRDVSDDGIFDEPGDIATILMSVDVNGVQANNYCDYPDISSDGMAVTFATTANLDPVNDTNGYYDIYVRNRDMDGAGPELPDDPINVSTSRVSVTAGGTQPSDFTYLPYFSGNGRHVVFTSYSPNLAPNDTNSFSPDVFVHDRDSDEDGVFDEPLDDPRNLTLVSCNSNGDGGNSYSSAEGRCISTSGRWVTFYSSASNLDPLDGDFIQDIFVHDRDVAGDGTFDEPGDISTTRISVTSSEVPANDNSWFPSISGDGTRVAFMSIATNLAPDFNGTYDIFVRDLALGTTQRVSVNDSGAEANGESYPVNISEDGSTVVYRSNASNLVIGDTNFTSDCFIRDVAAERTFRASEVSSTEPSASSQRPSMTPDGDLIIFDSAANDIVPDDNLGVIDVFLRKVSTGNNVRISVPNTGGEANSSNFNGSISADGRFVVFDSTSSNLTVPNDVVGFQDVFVRGLNGTVKISVEEPTNADAGTETGAEANSSSLNASISADGRFVAFSSFASDLVTGDSDGFQDIFVRDRDTDEDGIYDEPGFAITVRISVDTGGAPAANSSANPQISSTGRYVAYDSAANDLIPSDTNGFVRDIFVRDRDADGNGIFDEPGPASATICVSVDNTGVQGNSTSINPQISPNGRFVVFESDATNLVVGAPEGGLAVPPVTNFRDVYLHDRDVNGNGIFDEPGDIATVRLSVHTGGAEGNAPSFAPSVSGNGRWIVFQSSANNLDDNDTVGPAPPAFTDIFLRDRQLGTTTLLSRALNGAPADGNSTVPFITPDGKFVIFVSNAKNLTEDLEGGTTNDIFRIGPLH